MLYVACPPQKEDKSVHPQLPAASYRTAGSACSSVQAFERAHRKASNICANVGILGDVSNFIK